MELLVGVELKQQQQQRPSRPRISYPNSNQVQLHNPSQPTNNKRVSVVVVVCRSSVYVKRFFFALPV